MAQGRYRERRRPEIRRVSFSFTPLQAEDLHDADTNRFVFSAASLQRAPSQTGTFRHSQAQSRLRQSTLRLRKWVRMCTSTTRTLHMESRSDSCCGRRKGLRFPCPEMRRTRNGGSEPWFVGRSQSPQKGTLTSGRSNFWPPIVLNISLGLASALTFRINRPELVIRDHTMC